MRILRLAVAPSRRDRCSLRSRRSPSRLARRAPAFTLTDTAGKTVQLADYRGKYVVLEWTNPECPFVRKHYSSGNMQGLQKEWGAREVVWLSINSTNADSSEFKTPAQMAQWMQAQGAAQKATLIDGTSAAAPGVRRAGHASYVRHRSARATWSTTARSTTAARRIPPTRSSRATTCAPR